MSTDPITRLNATLEGRYRIERELGEGGMATVYLAHDLRHERRVALKVLKPELAAVVGADRFLAEIKTTANLQHPHILPLFDSGEADGLLFYAMPYVAGESLRERLERERQLPVDDAVRIASAVAEALDHAHRQGVVHRDMKPANILLRDGQPLVADFGIALAGAAGGIRLTETGFSVGTPQYMSPEQATGDQSVGPASDTYSLGCILYESLVGEPPYTGSTPQAVLGRIITGEARSASAERPSVPPHVDATIRKALERVPADRFRRAADFAAALGDPAFRHRASTDVGEGNTARVLKRLVQGLATAVVVLAIVSMWLLLNVTRASSPAVVERFGIDAPGATEFASVGISTEGSALVFVGPAEGGRRQLWIRRWHELASNPIPGTEGTSVRTPAVSPDATEVAFVADGQLRAIPLDGGVVRTLADSVSCCPRWGTDGFVYYTRLGSGIDRTPAAGGPSELVTRPIPGDRAQADLEMLPGGEAALFTVVRGSETSAGRIEVISFETGARRVLTPGVHPHYVAATGQLVFGTRSGEIMAAPFDVDRMELTGTATRLVDGVFTEGPSPRTTFSLSAAGRLVYLRARGGREDAYEFVWLDRNGVPTPVDSTLAMYPSNVGWSLAPDESRFAFNSEVDGNNDIYVKHLPYGPVERITTSAAAEFRPFWTADGERILYFSSNGSVLDSIDLWSIRADGTGPELVVDGRRGFADGSLGPDGDWVVLRTTNSPPEAPGMRGLVAFRPGVDTAAAPLLNDPDFQEQAPVISPNGRWLAYVATRTGRSEVYVNPFPDVERPRVQISTGGGSSPRWGAGGEKLFYWRPDGAVVSTSLDPVTGSVLASEALFTVPGGPVGWIGRFEVASDGRFLMARQRSGDDPAVPQIIVVQNFVEELRRLVRD